MSGLTLYEAPSGTPEQLAVELFMRRYVVLSDDQAVALALWVIHTWAFSSALVTPYIAVTSPTLRAGKSRLFEVLALVVRDPIGSSSITPAALYRSIALRRPTLLLDEVDATWIGRDLRAILNDGYHHRGAVTRTVGGVPQDFPTFCPKAFAGIGTPLAATLLDRSIPIRLKRRAPDEWVERFRRRDAEIDSIAIKTAIGRWAEENAETLATIDPEIPAELNDRAADVWEPLLAIADVIGYSDRARQAAVRLSGTDDEPDEGVQLLTDIHTIYVNAREIGAKVPSGWLVRALQLLPDPTFERGYGGLQPGDLARRLKAFGIRPKVLRFGAGTVRGYEWSAFDDAWRRYLPQAKQA